MLHIISLHLNNRKHSRLEQGEMHLLEHCIVTKFEQWMEKENINHEGIIMNAETFIDTAFIEVIYSNVHLKGKLHEMFSALYFTEEDFDIIESELEILQSENELDDLTEEDKFLYKGIKEITGYTIADLNKTDNISVTKDLMTKFNETIQNGLQINYSDNEYILNNPADDLEKSSTSLKSISVVEEEFVAGYISNPIHSIRDYFVNDFYSFLLGQSNQSLIHEQILDPNRLYLGYTHNVLVPDRFNILFIVMHNGTDVKAELENLIHTNVFKDMTADTFKQFKNAYLTFFMMNNTDPRYFMQSLGKIFTQETNLSMESLQEMIQSITIEDCQSILEAQEKNLVQK